MLSLQAMWVGGFGVQPGHKPFSLRELKEIKKDLGSYTNSLDQYVQTVEHIWPVQDLAWKNVMLLLDNTLTSSEGERV